MGEMSWDVAKAAVEKYAAENASSSRNAAENASRSGLREVIPSTMGEPLLYSYFEELLNLCVERGISLNLTTNGTFPGIWGTDEGMRRLLKACNDIKVSSLASECFGDWKRNIERLVEIRKNFANLTEPAATISLQVTLHKENLMMIPEIIAWAEAIGIERIKWNTAVFLSVAPVALRERYALPLERVSEIRNYVKGFAALGSRVKHEGNLFFERRGNETAQGSVQSSNGEICGFDDELWILPDGSEQHCPNPERRFGNRNAPEALCVNCPMRR
ncbi:MAG: hypothetical protein MJZ25_07820 [Fibrobacter sp.]|nr:hypothetical protein [Fibrobacter sp.]